MPLLLHTSVREEKIFGPVLTLPPEKKVPRVEEEVPSQLA